MPRQAHADSWYAATAHPQPDYPELTGALSCDVCVVGGGYTGVTTALELAERGLDVVLLEANRIGWGASGRNGGQICTGFSSGPDKLIDWVGLEDARRLFAMTEEGKQIIRDRVAKHGIDCDLTWGYFHAADRPRELRECEEAAETLSKLGYEAQEMVRGAEAARQHAASPRYIGGLYESGAGHLHPLNYCLGLARAAAAAGVRIFEGTRAESIDTEAAKVATAKGSVSAKFLVLAMNAYLSDLVPGLRSRIMPVGTYIAATETLGENRAKGLIPRNAAVADMKFVLNYFRRSSDHRLLFGGRVSYSTLMPPNLPRAMRQKMLEVYPDLADVGFDFTWGGFVAITVERSPHLGRIGQRTFFAQGFSGSGVTLTGIAGRVLAEAIAGQAGRLDLFAKLPHTPFPGGRILRTPSLVLAMLWYRLRDLVP
ncbi:NAD(P)/FAD-dependent oxidoreductase [Algihabitans albus]|uniref:NAD(P)/FAD-dependent oxidoreductase n=1 Tax=Algihabitans albus TaxID=2164067 RepID=UPI000E5CCE19|nr:FAD-binding oxidoreductase [Algihabitans albus]